MLFKQYHRACISLHSCLSCERGWWRGWHITTDLLSREHTSLPQGTSSRPRPGTLSTFSINPWSLPVTQNTASFSQDGSLQQPLCSSSLSEHQGTGADTLPALWSFSMACSRPVGSSFLWNPLLIFGRGAVLPLAAQVLPGSIPGLDRRPGRHSPGPLITATRPAPPESKVGADTHV